MSKANARRPIAALTAALLCVALAACGGGGGSDSPSSTTSGGATSGGTTNAGATATSTQYAAGLTQPSGVARDAAGNVYVADKGTNTVRRISTAGGTPEIIAGVSGTAGNTDGPATTATFSDLRGITVTPDGVVYVSDNNSVRMIRGGTVTTVIGEANLDNPQGVAVDAEFNIFVADATRGTITRGSYDAVADAGRIDVIAEGLTNPTSLALGGSDLYVTEVGANGATTIKKITGAATRTTPTPTENVAGGTGLSGVTGIAVGVNNTIYAVGARNLTAITSSGATTTKTVQSANSISGIAAAEGNVLVSDSANNNILQVAP